MATSTISAMISLTAHYALQAAVYLARPSSRNEFVKRSEIARMTQVPSAYLLKVLNGLDRAGVIESKRGPGGGYCLASDPSRLTVLEVFQAVDEIPRIRQCPLGLSSHIRLCPLHRLLDKATETIEEAFRNVTLAELIPQHKKAGSCCFPIATSTPPG